VGCERLGAWTSDPIQDSISYISNADKCFSEISISHGLITLCRCGLVTLRVYTDGKMGAEGSLRLELLQDYEFIHSSPCQCGYAAPESSA